ncbi:hypothetical protein HMPREF9603_01787 [Cutibacterium acnes HL001PA1]|nr:hypothetical protein HMPREF9603_01787 [Cutibacterium acnes HL001PA1]
MCHNSCELSEIAKRRVGPVPGRVEQGRDASEKGWGHWLRSGE